MSLMRVLQSGLKLQTRDGAISTGDNICGSMAKHFQVSGSGELSFYQVISGSEPSAERIALGVMLTKVRGGRARVDDVEACLIDEDAVQATGVHAHQDKGGETPLPDVNEMHWAVENVTIRRLAELIVAALNPKKELYVSRAELAFALDKLRETAECPDLGLSDQVLDDLAEIRKTKAYKKLGRGG